MFLHKCEDRIKSLIIEITTWRCPRLLEVRPSTYMLTKQNCEVDSCTPEEAHE